MSTAGREHGDLLVELAGEMAEWARSADPAHFYEAPAEGEWSVMENLAHAVEFLRYWADQVVAVAEKPGQPFGRTHDDAERIAWVAEHGRDDPAEILAVLGEAAEYARRRLMAAPDEAWATATGIHANRGEMTLPAIVEFFLTGHLRSHLVQAQKAFAAVVSSPCREPVPAADGRR